MGVIAVLHLMTVFIKQSVFFLHEYETMHIKVATRTFGWGVTLH